MSSQPQLWRAGTLNQFQPETGNSQKTPEAGKNFGTNDTSLLKIEGDQI